MPENDGANTDVNGAANNGSNPPDTGKVTPPIDANANGNGSSDGGGKPDVFTELGIDQDTRDWMVKRNLVKDGDDAKAITAAAAKLAREQDKLLGNAIRVPGKDATPEEKAEYLNKLGRPPTPEEYKFEVPKTLPEDLPYDGERAKAFGSLAHEIGLTQAQAARIHDWATENAVGDFNASSELRNQQMVENAKAETAKLVKLWGPLDGETMKANLTFADKVLNEVGGADAIAEFKRVGLIGEGDNQKIVQSAPIAMMLAKLGQAVFKEGDVIRGSADRLNNPFADGETFNLTRQMQIIKENPALANSMILAAGKKPEDIGLKAQ